MHLFALALSAFLLAPQEPAAPPALQPQSFSIGDVIERAVGITSQPDGDLVGAGPRWNAHWQGRDLDFSIESMGHGEAPSLGVRFEQMRRDGAPSQPGLPSAARVETDAEGLQRRVSRVAAPGVVEHWIASELGLELAFELDQCPVGHGDLRFALSVDTCLSAPLGRGDLGAGLGFTNAQGGGIQVGGVTAVDADGRTTPGWLEWDGAELVLGVPGDFVDTCAYPLLVDPTFSGVLAIPGTSNAAQSAAVAWDPKKSIWCVVWRYALGLTKFSYRVQRMTASGAPYGSAQTLVSAADPDGWVFTGTRHLPRIVHVSGSSKFAIVVASDAPGKDEASLLHWFSVDPKSGFTGAAKTDYYATVGLVGSYDLGTDARTSSKDFLTSWSVIGTGVFSSLSRVEGTGKVWGKGYYPSGVQYLTGESWPESGGEQLAVSGSTGLNGRWLVAWTSAGDAWNDPHLSARLVNDDGSVGTWALPIDTVKHPDRIDGVWIAGDGAQFFVGYRYVSGSQTLIYKHCKYVAGEGLTAEPAAHYLASFPVSEPGSGVRPRLSVRRIRGEYVAAWLARAGTETWALHAARLRLDQLPVHATPLALPDYSSEDRFLSIGSQTEARLLAGDSDVGMVVIDGSPEVLRTFVTP